MEPNTCEVCEKTLPNVERLRAAHLSTCAAKNPDLLVKEDLVNHPVTAPAIPTARVTAIEEGVLLSELMDTHGVPPAAEEPIFSDYGKYLLDAMLRWQPRPVLLIGDSGWGKTYLAKYGAGLSGKGFLTINCNEQMSMDSLVGIPAPTNSENGIFLEFADGARPGGTGLDYTSSVRHSRPERPGTRGLLVHRHCQPGGWPVCHLPDRPGDGQ